MVENNTLPWIKDNSYANVWNTWSINNRDLVFINKDGEIEYTINLTSEFDESLINSYISNLLLNH